MNNDYKGTNWFCNFLAGLFSVANPDEVLKYICLGLTALATLISILYSIYKWWKEAHADGKITKEELEQLGNIVQDGKTKIDNVVDTMKGEDKK